MDEQEEREENKLDYTEMIDKNLTNQTAWNSEDSEVILHILRYNHPCDVFISLGNYQELIRHFIID